MGRIHPPGGFTSLVGMHVAIYTIYHLIEESGTNKYCIRYVRTTCTFRGMGAYSLDNIFICYCCALVKVYGSMSPGKIL